MTAALRFILFACAFALSFAAARAEPAGSRVWVAVGTGVNVINLGSEPATVNVRSFTASGQAIASASKALSLAPGAAGGGRVGGGSYIIVVATQPVVVTAFVESMMYPNGGSGAAFPTYTYNLPSTAYPVDCAGAAANHFACSQRVGGFGFRPNIDLPARPTPN